MVTEALRFECQPGCIKCCDQDGLVYLSEDDIKGAAQYVGLGAAEFENRYVYRTARQRRFRKPADKQCPFLEAGGCSIHPAKPTQCRTFPFWPEIVKNKRTWKKTGEFCPGIGKGELIQISSVLKVAEEQKGAYPEHYQRTAQKRVKSSG